VSRTRKTRRIRAIGAANFAIGYQLEFKKASKREDYGQILKIGVPNKATKYNRYVITDPATFSRPPPSTTRPSLRVEIARSGFKTSAGR
jgi:hypothetical protein